ncbi:MAG: GGDEF domain-containing protein [Clostridiales bacterium]|jgi:diguanylate cyclase (GGDEF)-like protein/PAS domain S-box-containing protein|nr:GGDEF domain-containing protein [Clostridiales bacterium]
MKRVWNNLRIEIVAIIILVALTLSLSLYLVTYIRYRDLTLELLKDDAEAINKYAAGIVDEKSFTDLNTIDDETSELYETSQNNLRRIREIANLRYLYTAKQNEEGQFIYVMDGIDRAAEDFRHPGDLIEAEIIPDLSRCLDGETVFGDEILNTEWGYVYVVYFPFNAANGDVIGAIGMEFDCDKLYDYINFARIMTIIIALAVSAVSIAVAYIAAGRFIKKTEKNIKKLELEVSESEELTKTVKEASPVAYILCNEDLTVLDCNAKALKLFACEDKDSLIGNYWRDYMPEYQPDGRNSMQKAREMAGRCKACGRYVFEWFFKTAKGDTFPTEVSLTRLDNKSGVYLIVYMYDLSNIRKMEQSIHKLKNEAEKIFYDPLTGVYNRRFLDETMNRVMRRMSRDGTTLSIMMIDLDFFKRYNDTYGHAEGDKCLKAVAGILTRGVTRSSDFVARYGGEEFVIVLPDTEGQGACAIAAKLLENVRKAGIPHINNGAADCVTISIGVTAGKVLHAHALEDFIEKADEMLYKSKNGGRNTYHYEEL